MRTYYLNLGGIIVALKGESKTFLEFMERESSKFLLGAPDLCDFQLTIKHLGKIFPKNHFVDLKPKIAISKNIVEIDNNLYKGRLDISKGVGDVYIAPDYPRMALEYMLRVIASVLAIKKGGFMIHAGGVIHHRKGLVFVGKSGAGKTTITGLAPERVQVLNDDLNIILPKGDSWMIHGTPFTSSSQVPPQNGHASLNTFFFLYKAEKNRITPELPGVAFASIVANIPLLDKYSSYTDLILQRIKFLIETCGVYKLEFQKDVKVWDLILETIDAGSI